MYANLKLSDLMIKDNLTVCWRGYISVWNININLYFFSHVHINDCNIQYYNQVFLTDNGTCKS